MSTAEFELNCSVRTDLGKGASRRLRRLNNDIPAVLYGAGKDPVSLTIAHKDIIKATENEAFFSHIITLNVGSKKEQAVIKALQRHPAKPFIMHADFLRVSAKQAIVVKVPIHFLNEDKCVGVKIGGGSILKTLNEIEVSCLPADLPEFVEIDMIEVDVGESIHLSAISLPKGVTSVALSHGDESDLSVATVAAQKAEMEEEGISTEDSAADDSGDGDGDADAGGESDNDS
jgi:large subunit ribosomal protein L25